MRLFSAVIFDLDGTLIDSAPVVGSILNGMRAARSLAPLPLSFYRELSSQGGITMVGRALEAGQDEAERLLFEFRATYSRTATPVDSVYPTVPETLQELRSLGYRLAICSNKPEHLCRKVLEETNLFRFFDGIVGGDTLPVRKPDRAPVERAVAFCGENPKSVFVGDSMIDYHAAQAACLPFIYFSSGYEPLAHDAEVFARIARMRELSSCVGVS